MIKKKLSCLLTVCFSLLPFIFLTACGTGTEPVQDGPQEVVIATASMDTFTLKRVIQHFNDSQSDYQVRLEEVLESTLNSDGSTSSNTEHFMAATEKLKINLVTGIGGYDMLMLNESNFIDMDIQSLCRAGVFEDLGEWLDKDGGLERDDFFNMVLTAYDMDGTLFTLPSLFQFHCLCARQSLLGDKTEWTLREFLDFAEEYPEMRITDFDITEYVLLHLYLNGTFSLVETDENGEFIFDDQLCADYLEFLKGIPNRQGDYTLSRAYVDFETAQWDRDYYQDTFTYIGYPSQDRQNGCVVRTDSALSICSNSDCKEGAWAFLEYYLQYLEQDERIYDANTVTYPALKKLFDARAEQLLYQQWDRDENGEILLDAQGNPKLRHTQKSGNFVHPPLTEEDVTFLRDFLSRGAHIQLYSTEQLYNILAEESKAYFNDQKTLAEVVEIIRRRMLLYYQEQAA